MVGSSRRLKKTEGCGEHRVVMLQYVSYDIAVDIFKMLHVLHTYIAKLDLEVVILYIFYTYVVCVLFVYYIFDEKFEYFMQYEIDVAVEFFLIINVC